MMFASFLRPHRLPSGLSTIVHSSPVLYRRFYTEMANLSVELTAPNGRSYIQPIGLFINNDFVVSKSGEKLASINPS